MRVKAPQQSSEKIVDRRLLPLSTEAGQLEVVGRGRPDASDGLHFHHHTIQISRQAKSAAPACEPQIRAAFMPDEPRSVNLDESSASTTQPTEAPQELALQFKPHPIASLTDLYIFEIRAETTIHRVLVRYEQLRRGLAASPGGWLRLQAGRRVLR